MHDDVIKWKHFPRNWPFVRGIHRYPVNSPHKGQWRGALMFSLIRVRINGCFLWSTPEVNNREAGDVRRQHGHYDVIVMVCCISVHDSTRKSCIKVIILVCGWCQPISSKSKCPIQVCVFQIFHIFLPVVYQHKMQTGFCWGCINMVFFLTCIPKYCFNGTGTILRLPK